MERWKSCGFEKMWLRSQKIAKALALVFVFTIAMCAASYGYHLYQIEQTEHRYRPIGQMIDVGSYKLHYYAMGENKGLPTIILESGSGTPSSYSDWRHIQPELAQMTKVIAYDRAGYGWSEDANNVRSSQQIVHDLHKLLTESGESGPFILVGHSFGGLNVQFYAHQYSSEVAGLVLLDSSIVGESPEVTPSQVVITKLLRQSGWMRVMGELGILPVPEPVLSDDLSEQFLYKRFYNRDQLSELEQMGVGHFPKISLGSLPVTIISAREEEENYENWQALQNEYLTLSTNSERIIAENSSHYIHHDQPELVIEAIKEMLLGNEYYQE
jgi:pimeloyl-ACP methyl ester carboxylesterase